MQHLTAKFCDAGLGRRREVTDTIHAAPAARLHATLDRAGAPPTVGDALPAAWHWLYFLEASPLGEAGRDGHAERGEFLPPVALPRRMWGGGRLEFSRAITIGETIKKQSTITDITQKKGRSGALCFVTVRHEFFAGDEMKMSEEHDIVYREDGDKNAPVTTPPPAPTDADTSIEITPSNVLLFRYSALTFNSHRIHYDADYCREVEGLPGLVVHGPLTATLLAGMAHDDNGNAQLTGIEFRAISPLFANQPITLARKKHDDKLDLWAANARGELAMTATVK